MTEIKAIIFDMNGVLYRGGGIDKELFEYITYLKQSYKVAVLTSMGRATFNAMVPLDLRDVFDDVFVVDEIGSMKPDPTAFIRSASGLKVKTTECVMIDDSEANIRGAESVGMTGIFYQGLDFLKTDMAKLAV